MLTKMFNSLFKNRRLIYQMTKRDIQQRYKGSAFGILWSLINPIIMLMVYTVVFSMVFKARWGVDTVNSGKTQFAIILFVGMIIHSFMADNIMRAPSLIIQNANYVKKVIFPLEILPAVTVLSVLFHSIISFVVLILAFIIFNGYLHWTVLFAPIIFLPLMFLTLGLNWLLSALGLYIRDIGQFTGIIVTLLMFLSPVFYPLSAVPVTFQKIVLLNPLTFIIEQAREVIVWGHLPHFYGLFVYTICSLLIMFLCYAFFEKTRKGFADVI